MTSNSLTSLRHHQSLFSGGRPLPSDTAATPASLFLKFPSPTTTPPSITTATSTTNTAVFSLSSATSSSSAATATAASTSQPVSLATLRQHLAAQDFRKADEDTRRLLIVLTGEPAQKRGYVFFSEVQFISAADLKAIDNLWREHSNNRFGYSIQKKIWKKSNRDFSKLFMKLGWMKKLDTEVEQYNYRAFPDEFTWELSDETPEGHLPLTNALRGTQLFNSILSHPAFEANEEEEGEAEVEELKRDGGSKPLSKMVFKTDYSF